jgi:glycosyltransferase involved in cell wall biosynthesis
VLVIEPDFTGHRWRYAHWAALAYREAGWRSIVVTMPANRDHSLAREIADERPPGLDIAFIEELGELGEGPRARAIARYAERIPYARHYRYFARAYRRMAACGPIALVVVPYLDYFLYALPFLGSPFGETPWLGITMRATFHHRAVGIEAPARPIVNAVKIRLFRRAVETQGLLTLLSIDPTLPAWSDRALSSKRTLSPARTRASIAYLADPYPDARTDDPTAARSRLGFGPERHLLVYGSITERKGLFELVYALEQMARPPTLVVAGEQDAPTRMFLHAHVPRLTPAPVIIDRFISNDMERDLFSACDVVWLGYKGHAGMSGVLVQAYRFGKRVVATSEGLIGWFCAGGTLGPVLDDLSPAAIARGIEAALEPAAGADRANAGAHSALLERNTLDAFKRTLRDAAHPCAASSRSFGEFDEA